MENKGLLLKSVYTHALIRVVYRLGFSSTSSYKSAMYRFRMSVSSLILNDKRQRRYDKRYVAEPFFNETNERDTWATVR
jgi:hypothetical protein